MFVEATDQLVGPLTNSEQFTFFLVLAVSNVSNEMIFGRRLEYDEDLAVFLTHFPLFFMRTHKYNSSILFSVSNLRLHPTGKFFYF